MKTILLWLYLKTTSLFGWYPKISAIEDLTVFSSGPLKNLSFLIRFADEGDKLGYNYQIVMIPKSLKQFVDTHYVLVDTYVGNSIRSTINTILRNCD